MISWALSELILKLALYACIAGVIGALSCRWLISDSDFNARLLQSARRFAIAGVCIVTLQFLVAVGSFNEESLCGMFDRDIAQMLWQSNVGTSVLWRIIGFALVLVSVLIPVRLPVLTSSPNHWLKLQVPMQLMAVLLLALSFAQVGHVSDLDLVAHAAITVHIVVLSLWAGSFSPLLSMLKHLPPQQCQQAMERYGRVAVFVIGALIVSGSYLVWRLFDIEVGFSSNYNLLLILKISIVIALLALGARNKVRLVPNLSSAQHSSLGTLKVAITTELLLAIIVLVVTSVFTTLMGPGY